MPDAPDFVEQREVLRVARADLEDVGVLRDKLDVARVHHLRDDRQAGLVARGGEDVEALLAVAPEGVRARARLEGAAAQDVPAGSLHRPRGLDARSPRCRRSTGRPSRRRVPSPICTGADAHDGVVRVHLAAGQLERLADADDRVDAVDDAELVDQLRVDVAEYGDDVALLAVDAVVLEPELADHFLYAWTCASVAPVFITTIMLLRSLRVLRRVRAYPLG